MRLVLLGMSILSLCVACAGCSRASSQAKSQVHSHETVNHMPKSLGDLCQKILVRLDKYQNGDASDQIKSELTDLVSWAPEFAADTDLSERLWIPIYQASEKLRSSIESDKTRWDQQRVEEIAELCRISEQAWLTLDPEKQIERYQDHSHDEHHGHSHEHHDHDHGDHQHEHADHDHGEHHHEHGDHDHGDHDDGDHDHSKHHHEHGDHDHSHANQGGGGENGSVETPEPTGDGGGQESR